MRFSRTSSFKKSYKKLPEHIQRKTDRILAYLLNDLMHPSVRSKKIQGVEDVWEGRIDKFYRFTFQIESDEILLRSIGPHDITKKR